MKKIAFLFLALMIIGLVACGPVPKNKTGQEIPAHWDSISGAGYSIHYPDTFIIDTLQRPRMELALLSRQVSPEDPFRENISLVVQKLGGQAMDLSRYVEMNATRIQEMFPGGQMLEREKHSRADLEYYELVFTGNQNEVDLKVMQQYWMKGGKAYILTFSAELSQYDNYLGIGQQVMNTFRLK